MKINRAALAWGMIAIGAVAGGHPAAAQTAQFPDVPQNHWAYQAVMDLANKGYVQGYPNGDFMGNRAMTRYEFATVIDRIVHTIDGLSTQVGALQTPTGQPVTQDDLNKIQALVDTFQPQLDAIQAHIGDIQSQLDALRGQLSATTATANKALTAANSAYSSNTSSKFNISGYIQARFDETTSGSESLYPRGTAFNNGNSYNGSYEFGNNGLGFLVRRARIQFAGAPTVNTRYAIQVDTSGPNSTPVTLRNAFGSYVLGDGNPSKNLVLTAGQFANPFGYELYASSAAILSPERPLGFNENGIGIWNNSDYVVGAQLAYSLQSKLLFIPKGLNLSFSAVNPNGRNIGNNTRHIDTIYRASYKMLHNELGVGASWYDGEVSSGGVIPATAAGIREPKKSLYGLDGQFQAPGGLFLNAEYEAGLYETRSYLNTTLATPTFATDEYVKGNQISAYYVQGGYTFGQTGAHPLTLAASYDALYRSHAAQSNGQDVVNGVASPTISSGGGSYDDVNFGYGALYNLDKDTRLRVWYEQPYQVAHAAGTPQPQRVGMFTTEVQFKF